MGEEEGAFATLLQRTHLNSDNGRMINQGDVQSFYMNDFECKKGKHYEVGLLKGGIMMRNFKRPTCKHLKFIDWWVVDDLSKIYPL